MDAAGSGVELSPRSVAILTYALCGFANFSSIGIQIGGIGGIAPELPPGPSKADDFHLNWYGYLTGNSSPAIQSE